MGEFKMQRICTLMKPEPGNDMEAEGVLNPGAARGPDGHLYLFPRMVAKGNYSRIGIARVIFNDAGDPVDVERLGIALEPQAPYELRPGGGGCEDPRVSFIKPLGHYAMNYVAFSKNGPRIAVARSNDLIHWERLGLATFSHYKNISFDEIDDKDSCDFPLAVPNPHGQMELGILHRPIFPGTSPEEMVQKPASKEMDIHLQSIWISYHPIDMDTHKIIKSANFTSHHRLAAPEFEWEKLKIGCGAPPVMTKHGWMVIYHGVSELPGSTSKSPKLRYSAGVMILDKDKPTNILYRSPKPVLTPDLPEEKVGYIANVVFPTGIDCRTDIGMPNRFDIYYGMADDRIGVARLDVPDELPG